MKDAPVVAVIALAFGVVTFLVLGLAIVFPGPPPAVSAPAAPAASVTTAPEPASSTVSGPDYDFLAGPGETVKVTRIIDGDTFAVGRRTIKVIGIDSCPTSTNGGRQAVEFAQNQLMNGYPAVLRRAPGLNKDSAGRELRVVEEQEHGFDYAQSIVPFTHTKANAGGPGPAAYLATLRDMDSDGRDCSQPREETTTPTVPPSDDGDDDRHVYLGDGDGGMRDGALTGGYCRKKWWC